MRVTEKYKYSFRNRRNIDIKVIRPSNREIWIKCERLEYEIFHQSGYVPFSAECRINDFDCYPKMEFLAAYEKGGGKNFIDYKLLGTLRFIYSSQRNLMKESFPTLQHARKLDYTLNDFLHDSTLKPPYEDNETLWLYADKFDRLMACDPRKFVDWAAMAVTEKGRDIKATASLLAAAVKKAWEQPPIKYCFLAVDCEVIRKYKERIPQIVDLGPPSMYWGSKTIPILANVYQLPKGIQKLLILVYRIKGYVQLLK